MQHRAQDDDASLPRPPQSPRSSVSRPERSRRLQTWSPVTPVAMNRWMSLHQWRRFDERQGGGSGSERRGARAHRGACPQARGAEVAVRPLQDHPSPCRRASRQGDRRADRRARTHGRQVVPMVRREAHRGPRGRAPLRPVPHRDGRQGGGGGRADAETREALLSMIAAHAPKAWVHVNMLGECDFSEDKPGDAFGVPPLKSAT